MVRLKGEHGLNERAMMAIVMCTVLSAKDGDKFNEAFYETLERIQHGNENNQSAGAFEQSV